MVTLGEFLAARLAEDEYHARAAQLRHGGPWCHEPTEDFLPGACDLLDKSGARFAIVSGSYLADYLSRQDPARVLRAVEAGRKILAEHAPGYPVTYPEPSGQPTCGVCHAGGWDWDPQQWPCPTIRMLAAVWGDHPAYDPAWSAA